MLEVEWTVTHYAQIDIDAIVERIQQNRQNYKLLSDLIDRAILEEISGQEDDVYYSWTDNANARVRKAVEKRLTKLGIT